MILPTNSIDYLLFIMDQGNLVYDLSLSILLLLLFIRVQVELIEDISKVDDIPHTFYR